MWFSITLGIYARLIDIFAHRIAKDIVDAVETIESKNSTASCSLGRLERKNDGVKRSPGEALWGNSVNESYWN
ncbi:hypothetical protein [Pseudomonas sp. Tri1]|uniref:hypothetical protein n=1 Tax=Pseudomonas sp. Tri1 TaxID=2823875 RepID=UPI001B329B58|nr:hypothetical protein [Pseudomonas sp. Tri1]